MKHFRANYSDFLWKLEYRICYCKSADSLYTNIWTQFKNFCLPSKCLLQWKPYQLNIMI